MKQFIYLTLFLTVTIIFTGCAAGSLGQDRLLQNYENGMKSRIAGNYTESNKHFDVAEDMLKAGDQEGLAKQGLDTVTTLLINDSATSYKANTYEGIMLNAYKAMNFMMIGDYQNARIEFNRALDRQRIAKEHFKDEIKEHKKEIAKKDANAKDIPLKKIVYNRRTQKEIREQFSNIYNFRAYPSFVNPFATYMAGLFFLSQKDYAKATDLFKESYGMVGKNRVIKNDLRLAGKGSRSFKKRKYAWIVYENGKSAIKESKGIKIPLLMGRNDFIYVGISLPVIKDRNSAFKFLTVKTAKKSTKTKLVSSMDKVIKTEHKKRFPLIVQKAVASMALKTYLQYRVKRDIQKKRAKREKLQKEPDFKDIGKQFMETLISTSTTIYSAVTDRADTRSWLSLPKEFQVARVKLTGKPIQIYNPKNELLADIDIENGKNTIIFIKIPDKTTGATYETFTF